MRDWKKIRLYSRVGSYVLLVVLGIGFCVYLKHNPIQMSYTNGSGNFRLTVGGAPGSEGAPTSRPVLPPEAVPEPVRKVPATTSAPSDGAGVAPQLVELSELQLALNAAKEAKTPNDAEKKVAALLELLAKGQAPLGLTAEGRIEMRKALERALAVLTRKSETQPATPWEGAYRAELDTAQVHLDAATKAFEQKRDKVLIIVLCVLGALILLPVIFALLMAAPEVLLVLALVGLLIAALNGVFG